MGHQLAAVTEAQLRGPNALAVSLNETTIAFRFVPAESTGGGRSTTSTSIRSAAVAEAGVLTDDRETQRS